MSEFLLNTAPRPLAFGATERAEIEQNIRLIVQTHAFSVRMDCRFAQDGKALDAPLPHGAARLIGSMVDAIELYEPRVRVLSLQFKDDAPAASDGRAYPHLRYAIKENAL